MTPAASRHCLTYTESNLMQQQRHPEDWYLMQSKVYNQTTESRGWAHNSTDSECTYYRRLGFWLNSHWRQTLLLLLHHLLHHRHSCCTSLLEDSTQCRWWFAFSVQLGLFGAADHHRHNCTRCSLCTLSRLQFEQHVSEHFFWTLE